MTCKHFLRQEMQNLIKITSFHFIFGKRGWPLQLEVMLTCEKGTCEKGQDIYVNMQHILHISIMNLLVDIHSSHVSIVISYVDLNILQINMINLHVHIDKSYVYIINQHVDINNLHVVIIL